MVSTSKRFEAAVESRDQIAVDEARLRLGVRDSRHDRQLLGVRDDDAFDRIAVVGTAAQHRGSRLDANQSGQRVGGARDVADQPDVVADDDRLAAEFACLDRRDFAAIDFAGEPAAIDGKYDAATASIVCRTQLAARPRATARPDAHVVFVEIAGPPDSCEK